ncbi:MAG TPA: hypothetical protein VG406_22785 [Isosphaeraceae bacterium]|jgi:hypothetical protein|nr:hypothetical protein [Isosphaeraceae bacterium]
MKELSTARVRCEEATATLSRTDRDEWSNRRATAQALRAAQARQVSGRRRFVDPTTCERDYSAAEIEFMQAMHEYKSRSGRMFPTWSEVLEVLRSLGYEKSALPPEPEPESEPANVPESAPTPSRRSRSASATKR